MASMRTLATYDLNSASREACPARAPSSAPHMPAPRPPSSAGFRGITLSGLAPAGSSHLQAPTRIGSDGRCSAFTVDNVLHLTALKVIMSLRENLVKNSELRRTRKMSARQPPSAREGLESL